MSLSWIKRICKICWLWLNDEPIHPPPLSLAKDSDYAVAVRLLDAHQMNSERTFDSEFVKIWISGRIGRDGTTQWCTDCTVTELDSSDFWRTKRSVEIDYHFSFDPNRTAASLDIAMCLVDAQGNRYDTFDTESAWDAGARGLVELEFMYPHEASKLDLQMLNRLLSELHLFTERPAASE